jgi:hypothetical protein
MRHSRVRSLHPGRLLQQFSQLVRLQVQQSQEVFHGSGIR